MNIQLYKKELHEKQIQDYIFENPEDGLKIGERGTYTEDDGTYWDLKIVYIRSKKVIGFLSASTCSVQRKVELSQIIVFKGNKKNGIGKEMFNFMIEYYKKLEMSHVKVMYYSNNDIGEFYKKLGFEDNFIAKYGTVRYGKWLQNINLIKFI